MRSDGVLLSLSTSIPYAALARLIAVAALLCTAMAAPPEESVGQVLHAAPQDAGPALEAVGSRRLTIEDSLALEVPRFAAARGVSADGEMLAYTLRDGYQPRAKTPTLYYYVPRGEYVFVRPIDSDEALPITQGDEFSWTPTWAPDGSKLAFYAWHDGAICLGVWYRASGRTDFFRLADISGRRALDWTPDGRRVLYFPTSFEGVGPIWPYEDDERVIVRTTWEPDSYEERFIEYSRSQLWGLDIASGQTVPIIGEDTNFYSYSVSPDGRWVAASKLTRWPVLTHLVPSYVTLEIHSVDGGDVRRVLADVIMTTPYSWSPDGASLAYVEEERLWLYDPVTDRSTPLGPESLHVSGSPLWRPNSNTILCPVEEGYVLLDAATGDSKPLVLDLPQRPAQVIWGDEGRVLLVKVVDDRSGQQGIYRIEPDTGATGQLFLGDRMIQQIRLIGQRLFFTLQGAATPENIWVADDSAGERRQLTRFNERFADRSMGVTELIHWTSRAGVPLKGVLLYPAGYQPGRSYPVIFWVYESFSHNLHQFQYHIYNRQVYANHGYAVFLPDVAFTMGETARSFEESVVPAMDRLLELGVANGNFGVTGRSFGGFATNIIVTRTSRFRAAISLAGITNWVSKYRMQGVFWRRGDRIGQGRLGGQLWDVPEAFIKNSPIFHLDKVETPIMIMQGTDDRNVHLSQAEQMYYALRDLEKPASLIVYPGETHLGGDSEPWVLIDIWQRMLAWFDGYLK